MILNKKLKMKIINLCLSSPFCIFSVAFFITHVVHFLLEVHPLSMIPVSHERFHLCNYDSPTFSLRFFRSFFLPLIHPFFLSFVTFSSSLSSPFRPLFRPLFLPPLFYPVILNSLTSSLSLSLSSFLFPCISSSLSSSLFPSIYSSLTSFLSSSLSSSLSLVDSFQSPQMIPNKASNSTVCTPVSLRDDCFNWRHINASFMDG